MSDMASHSSRSIKLKKLEKAWNPSISLEQESRRMSQMTQDIKHFIVKSMSDPLENRRFAENYHRERLQNSTNTFSTIASTLGFSHHEGTDSAMELRVIKVIMIREGILMSLKYAAELAERQGNLEGNNMLELMSQLRESTLNYLEYLCLWRQSAQSDSGEMQPRAFMWENQNYTMKLIADLDFLSENPVVVECLNLTQEQLRSNPLMLSNNLEDLNTWMAPEERAAADVNGSTNSAEFQTRLRLRYAERILLQEMELYNFEGSQIFMTQDEANDNNNGPPMANMQQQQPMQFVMVGSNALENEYENNAQENLNGNMTYQLQPSGQSGMPIPYFSPERRVKTTESSNRTADFSNPQSRASTITNGFFSAPSTSHGSRGHSQGAIIPITSAGGMVPMEYGHDFFTGNWGEGASSSDAFPFFSGSSLPQEEDNNPPFVGSGADGEGHLNARLVDDEDEGEEEVLYTENSQSRAFESYTPMNDMFPPIYSSDGIAGGGGGRASNMVDDEDNHSVRTVESVSDVDLRVLVGLFVPPKVVNLAGAVTVILMSKGNEIPTNASWPAFLKMMRKPGFIDAMNSLAPHRVTRFKLLAVQPMLDQIFYDERANHEEYSRKQMSFQELIAVTKLMNWVRQFSENESKLREGSLHEEIKKKTKGKKTSKTLVSPFKAPPGSLTPLQNNSQTSGSQQHLQQGKNKNTKNNNTPSPIHMTTGEQNVHAKEKMKASRVREKSIMVQLARKQHADDKDNKKKKSKSSTGDAKSGNNKGDVPASKKKIPKVQLDIVPFHQETVDSIYVHPILVVLLTSPDALEIAPASPRKKGNNNKEDNNENDLDNDDDETYSDDEEHQKEDGEDEGNDGENGGKDTHSVASTKSIKYVVPLIPKTSVEQTRLVVKVYDSTESKEAMTYVNMREYQLFLQDMPDKLTAPKEEVDMFFQPFDLKWWVQHIGKVVAVTSAGGGGNKSLKVSISKQKIEEFVRMQIVNLHRIPVGPGGRRNTFSTPRRSSVAPGSAGSTGPIGGGSINSKDSSTHNNTSLHHAAVMNASSNASAVTQMSSTSTNLKEASLPPLLEKSTNQQKPSVVASTASSKTAPSATSAKTAQQQEKQPSVKAMEQGKDDIVVVEEEEEMDYRDDAEFAENTPAPGTAASSIAYGDDFEEVARPANAEKNEKEIVEGDVTGHSAAGSHSDCEMPPYYGGDGTSALGSALGSAVGSMVFAEGDNHHHHHTTSAMGGDQPGNVNNGQTLPAIIDEDSIEDNFPELKPPSRITSTRTSVDVDAVLQQQQQLKQEQQKSFKQSSVSNLKQEDSVAESVAAAPVRIDDEGVVDEESGSKAVVGSGVLGGSESMYGSDFESSAILSPQQRQSSSIKEQNTAVAVESSSSAIVEDDNAADASMVLEVSANSIPDFIPNTNTVTADQLSSKKEKKDGVEVEEEEDDDGIYDDDLSETAQAPIDRSMSMSASMRLTSNPASSSKPTQVETVMEPEEDDQSLYDIPDI